MLRRACAVFVFLFVVFSLPAWAGQEWLAVSDLHVDPFDASGAPPSYGSDSNWALFDSTVAAMRRADPNPAVIVLSGDFLAHRFDRKVHAAGGTSVSAAALSVMSRMARTFARAFPHAQFVVELGNNDDACGDYRSGASTAYLAALARIWRPLVDRNGAAPDFGATFAREGYYTVRVPLAHTRAIALDDVFWSFRYRNACGRPDSNPGASEFRWFEKVLAATPVGTRNIVVMHIPPGIDPISTLALHRFVIVPFLNGGANARFLRDVTSQRNRVNLVLAGHLHRNDFRVDRGVPMLVLPSVSPVYGNNPAFTVLRFDDDGTLHDYTMHEFDVENDRWDGTFDFDRAYGVTSFTAPALNVAHRRIDQDPAMRAAWASAFVAGADQSDITSGNWTSFWCAQTELSGARYTPCAGDRRRAGVLPIIAGLAAAMLVALVAFLVMRLARQRGRA